MGCITPRKRPVEATDSSYGEAVSQSYTGLMVKESHRVCQDVISASLGYPLSVISKNTTINFFFEFEKRVSLYMRVANKQVRSQLEERKVLLYRIERKQVLVVVRIDQSLGGCTGIMIRDW